MYFNLSEKNNVLTDTTTPNQILSLEKQLEILNAIQKYSLTAMQVRDRLGFFELTINTIATAFKQSNVFLFDINPKTKIVNALTTTGFTEVEARNIIGIYPKELVHLAIFELNDSPILKSFFTSLKLDNALICEVNRSDLGYSGIFIISYSNTDISQNLIPQNQHDSLRLLIQKAGLINYHLRQNERLLKEIEERKLAEQRIAEQAVELKRSNEDLEQFAYVISHDLKAPLRNINSFAQLLKHSFGDDINEESFEYLGFILSGVKQFGALIDDLLIYSRAVKREIHFEETEFDLVIDTVKFNLQLLIEETGTIINYKNLPELKVNFLQMTQVFQNLISNAIKFNQKDEKTVINISAIQTEKDFVTFKISDNGIGIEEEFFERIFSLFQRLHTQSEYEGSGLGLSICKKIIERHKGEIWVESDGLNKGANFYFTIPTNL